MKNLKHLISRVASSWLQKVALFTQPTPTEIAAHLLEAAKLFQRLSGQRFVKLTPDTKGGLVGKIVGVGPMMNAVVYVHWQVIGGEYKVRVYNDLDDILEAKTFALPTVWQKGANFAAGVASALFDKVEERLAS